jgi:hypothetical protein
VSTLAFASLWIYFLNWICDMLVSSRGKFKLFQLFCYLSETLADQSWSFPILETFPNSEAMCLGVRAASNSYSGYPELWILRYPAHRYHTVPVPEFEPTTLWLRVRHPNHLATTLLISISNINAQGFRIWKPWALNCVIFDSRGGIRHRRCRRFATARLFFHFRDLTYFIHPYLANAWT